jgi:hypothetical protein
MKKAINPVLVNIVLVLIIVVGLIWIAKNINFKYFTFDRENCVYNYLQKTIDNNAYITNMNDQLINLVEKLYGLESGQIRNIKMADRAKITEQNKLDLMYIAKHPGWDDENLTRLGAALTNMGLEPGHYKISNIDVSDLGLVCPRPQLFR